jgi:hypothetical protein
MAAPAIARAPAAEPPAVLPQVRQAGAAAVQRDLAAPEPEQAPDLATVMETLDLRRAMRMPEPAVQRTAAARVVTPASQPRVQREDASMPVAKQNGNAPAKSTTPTGTPATTTTPATPPAKPTEPAEPDLHDLARKIYPIIRRMLAIERERR